MLQTPPSVADRVRTTATAAGPARATARTAGAGPARVLAVVVPGAVMLGLGLWGVDRGSMWRDETATFFVAQRSLPDLLRTLGTVDVVHGLYYLLMHFLLALHPGEVMLRLPSVLGAVAAACLVAEIGTRLVRPRVGLWAGLLFAVAPFTAHYAQEGRSYALVAAGALAATLLLLRAAARPGRAVWCAYGAAVTVTAWLHEFAVLLLVAHAVTLAAARARRAVWRGWALASFAAVLLLLPLAAVATTQSGQVDWIWRPGWLDVQDLLERAAGQPALVYAGTFALVAFAVSRPPAPRPGQPSGLVAVALPLAVLPPALLLLASQIHPVYSQRYVFFAFAGLPLLVAAGTEVLASAAGRLLRPGLPSHPLTAVCGAALAALFLVLQLPAQEWERLPAGRRDDYGAVARAVAHHVRPGDPVLYLPLPVRRLALAYPASVTGTRDVSLAVPAAASATLYGVDVRPEVLADRMECLDHVWAVIDGEFMRGRTDWPRRSPVERAKLTLLSRDFVLRREVKRKSAVLRLYERVDGPAPQCSVD
ncbi:glycosyltransferase family 39 protein [Streptomyces sp. VRA16 Mangrove soil]|uniref:glycosyltransferase family 39 protein n=1 Tax=Streptomyces sp. VRA16 Mangrove soil TaxID=2817434 RepID=UPI001A9D10B2|nr:glycosyltransferase family 39 protein [Streptomyces sp. VRA16 Mangrove soil]MBO1337582.1 glycosyltransferase family 39 protein [Streptomyces sp. VRA16 Mangrove soil]